MGEDLGNLADATIIVQFLLLVALVLTAARPRGDPKPAEIRRLRLVLGIAVAVQCFHFVEELVGGLHVRLPEVLGVGPVSAQSFINLNLFWIAVWAASIAAIHLPSRIFLFPAWFLGVAGAANGILHPILAITTGGYFPGLITSPFVGAAGVFLLIHLRAITDRRR